MAKSKDAPVVTAKIIRKSKADLIYTQNRSSCVKDAVINADITCGKTAGDKFNGNWEKWAREWNLVYFAAMDRIYKERFES